MPSAFSININVNIASVIAGDESSRHEHNTGGFVNCDHDNHEHVGKTDAASDQDN